MPQTFTCPQGHRWEEAGPPGGKSSCPTCGARAVARPSATRLGGPPASEAETVGSTVKKPRSGPVEFVPGYQVLGELGRGGMGVVYKALQVRLKRVVALKMVLSGAHAGAEELARFDREARTVARFQHPNIIQIYEVGTHEHQPFIALEYVDGGSLAAKMGSPWAPGKAAGLVATLAQAVHAAHQHNIIHRDLKPGNVLLSADGQPKITDFGLAKTLTGGESVHTQTGAILGTPHYMSPEQAACKKDIGPATDVYSLGAILYEMLAGQPPFRATNQLDIILKVLNEEPVPPSRLNSKVPRDLEIICLKCLHKDPDQRYGSAAALGKDLKRFLKGQPIRARQSGYGERLLKWARRKPAVVVRLLVTSLTILLLLVALIVANVRLRGLQEQTTDALERERQGRETAERDRDQLQATLLDRDKRAAGERARAEELQALGAGENLLRQSLLARAGREWAEGHLDRAEGLLDAGKGSDPPPWEWAYLKRQCHPEVWTLEGHRGPVNALALSPDGKRLVTGGEDGTIKFWDLAKGLPLRTLRQHAGPVYALAISKDGRTLASAGADGTVLLWDLNAWKINHTLRGHTGAVLDLAFHPAGVLLTSAGRDHAVRVWDANAGTEVSTLNKHAGAVTLVTFSPGGTRLASAGEDRALKLWDTATWQERESPPAQPREITGLSFQRNGFVLAWTVADDMLHMWDIPRKKEFRVSQGPVRQGSGNVVFSPAAGWVAATGQGNSVLVWGAYIDSTSRPFPGHDSPVHSVAFSPDGKLLASGGESGQVKVWDLKSNPGGLVVEEGPKEFHNVAISPNGSRIAGPGRNRMVKLWDARTGQFVRNFPAYLQPGGRVAFSPDGTRLACPCDDGTSKVWDVETAREVFSLPGGDEDRQVSFGPENRLLIVDRKKASLTVWDVETNKEVFSPPPRAGAVVRAVYSPDGRFLVTGSPSGKVQLWDGRNGTEVLGFAEPHPATILDLALSPDGRRVAAAGANGTVTLWDRESGKSPLTLKGHEGDVFGAAWSADGNTLATAGADQTVRLWAPSTGQETLALRGHRGAVYGVAFSGDGRLVSAGQDQTARVWDGSVSEEKLAGWEALGVIRRGLRQLLPREEIQARVKADADLREDVRRKVLERIDGYEEDPAALHQATWEVVKKPGADREAYRLALLRAEAACRLVPENVVYRNTLGKAAYRFGQYERTLEVLQPLASRRDMHSPLFFLAMAQQRLGHKKEATKLLEEGEKRLEELSLDYGPEERQFWQEANDLIPREPKQADVVVRVGPRLHLDWTGAHVLSMAFTRDGHHLLLGSDTGPSLRIYDLANGKVVRPYPGHKSWVNSVGISPDGKQALSGSQDGTLKVWDLGTAKMLSEAAHHGPVEWVTFSPDGKQVLSGGDDRQVCVWNLGARLERQATWDFGSNAHCVALSPDGRRVLAAGWDKKVAVWDRETGKELWAHPGAGVSAAFRPPNGKQVASVTDNTVRLWDAETGRLLSSFKGTQTDVQWVSFSPDGKWLLATDHRGQALHLWDVASGELLAYIKADKNLNRAVFSPDGLLVAAGTFRGNVYLWPLEKRTR